MLNQNDNKLSWQRLIDALTDPDKALNFPVKYPAIELDKTTKNSLYLTASIIAAGLIISAAIKTNK
jgi:hypothetical protein